MHSDLEAAHTLVVRAKERMRAALSHDRCGGGFLEPHARENIAALLRLLEEKSCCLRQG